MHCSNVAGVNGASGSLRLGLLSLQLRAMFHADVVLGELPSSLSSIPDGSLVTEALIGRRQTGCRACCFARVSFARAAALDSSLEVRGSVQQCGATIGA